VLEHDCKWELRGMSMVQHWMCEEPTKLQT
jgi:hypothetical protein